MTSQWMRVSRSRPCPICHKPDWCLLSTDGSAAICARVESQRRAGDAGWLHGLHHVVAAHRRHERRVVLPAASPSAAPDFAALARRYADAVQPAALKRLADELGVTVESLHRLGMGWTGRAWSCPHVDGRGTVCGIHLRTPTGTKPYIKGSHPGLAVPGGLGPCDPLLVCEGESDCAAALSLGLDAVARPGCQAGTQALRRFIRRHGVQHVVVVGDNDDAGWRGAFALADMLAVFCRTVRTIFPPVTAKDLRAWLRAGATAADVLRAVEEAAPVHLRIQIRKCG